MIDAHCHLNFKAFENDLEKVIESAVGANVSKIINVGSSLESSKKAVELVGKYKNLYAAVGIHPHHADKIELDWTEQLEKLAKGVAVYDKKTLPAETERIGYDSFRITLFQGMKRQIREMCKDVGLTVKMLNRISIGPIELGNLRVGKSRMLTQEEVWQLKSEEFSA